MEPKRVIRLAELTEYVGLGRTQILELVAQGRFPRPVRLSARRIAWLSHEIADWQARKIAERDANVTAAPKIERVPPPEQRPALSQARGTRR